MSASDKDSPTPIGNQNNLNLIHQFHISKSDIQEKTITITRERPQQANRVSILYICRALGHLLANHFASKINQGPYYVEETKETITNFSIDNER